MNNNLIRALDMACTANNISNISQDLITIIDEEKDTNIKRMIIYAIDDKLIRKFGNLWLQYLLEKKYFLTDAGGTQFYKYLQEYMINKDYTLLMVCAMILKNGFSGCFSTWPEHIYQEVLATLNIPTSSPLIYMPYIPHKKYNKPISWWWVVLPILLTYIIIQSLEILIFYNTTNLLKGVTL